MSKIWLKYKQDPCEINFPKNAQNHLLYTDVKYEVLDLNFNAENETDTIVEDKSVFTSMFAIRENVAS